MLTIVTSSIENEYLRIWTGKEAPNTSQSKEGDIWHDPIREARYFLIDGNWERQVELGVLERNYVILSIKWTKDALVFWGNKSEDTQARSYSGYTSDIKSCERYTFEEVRSKRSEFYEYKGESISKLRQIDRDGSWIIRVDELEKLGNRMTSYIL